MSSMVHNLNDVKFHASLVFNILIALPCFAQSAEIASLLRVAASGAADARYAAIDDLGERKEGAELVVPELAKLLKDKDPKVRWRSARSLGDFGQAAQSAVPVLRTLLGDKDPIVQYHAAVALGKAGDRSDATIEALVSTVTHSDGRVARAAVAALRSVNPDPKHVVAVLDHMLASDDQVVVVHALEAVVEHGAKATPILIEALKKPKTAYLACAAIEQIGPDAAATVPALTELLSDTKHSHLLTQALLALASIGPAAKSASPQIINLLEHPTDATVPIAAAYALGALGAADADKSLRAAAAKPNAMLQMVAGWSLAKIHPDDSQLKQQAMQKLQAGLKSKDPAIQAAAEKGLQLLEESPKKTAAE